MCLLLLPTQGQLHGHLHSHHPSGCVYLSTPTACRSKYGLSCLWPKQGFSIKDTCLAFSLADTISTKCGSSSHSLHNTNTFHPVSSEDPYLKTSYCDTNSLVRSVHDMTFNETELNDSLEVIYSADNYSHAIDICYGILSLICFLLGTLGNFAACAYFSSQRKDNCTVIYILITLVDVFISLLQLPVGVSYLTGRRPGLFRSHIFCDVWHFLWQILSRQSVALVAILSITRTLSILFPLKIRISKRAIVIPILLTFILQLITGSILYWYGGHGAYSANYVDCSYIVITPEHYFKHVIPTITWYWVPVLPVILSCIISYGVLQSSKRPGRESSCIQKVSNGAAPIGSTAAKNSATLTIVLLTFLYVIFNLPMSIANIFLTLDDVNWKKLEKQGLSDQFESYTSFDAPTYYLSNFIYCFCVPLNSLANPVLYFSRIKRLRVTVLRKLGMMERDTRGTGGDVGGVSIQFHNISGNQHRPLMRGGVLAKGTLRMKDNIERK
eukprot:sb/3464112/